MEKILIIDDSLQILLYLKKILGKDYDIFTLSDGLRAAEIAKLIKPDLILLDVIMPKSSGFEIIQEIKAEQELVEIPVIFLTGLSNEEDESKGFVLGAVDYITKPFRENIVLARVKTHLQMYINKNQLKKEQEYSKTILELANDLFWLEIELGTHKIKLSKNFAEYFQVPEVISDFPNSILEYGIISTSSLPDFQILLDKLKNGIEGYFIEIQLKRFTGQLLWFKFQYKLIYKNKGKPSSLIARLTDITEQKERMIELLERAETDPLTRLYNKIETQRGIESYLNSREPEQKCALLIIDLDNFKGINDNLGHQFGDAVLVDISTKIKKLFSEDDIIGRIGGDEFVVFMKDIPNEEIVMKKAAGICNAFHQSYTGEQQDYKISGSIGVSICPDHGSSFDELYRKSDLALYEAKHLGKDCFKIYSLNP